MADAEAAEVETRDADSTDETPATPTPDATDEGAGSKSAVLADLAAERDKRQDLEAQFNQFRDGLAKVLGIGSEKEATPEQLTEQLATAQSEAQQARVELAVFRAAPDGVDAQALLDSRSFTATLQGVDPDNAEAVASAISDFVTANPRFSTVSRAPGARDASAGGRTPVPARSMDDLLRGR